MSRVNKLACVGFVVVSLITGGCGSDPSQTNTSSASANSNKAAAPPNKDGTIPSGTGVEKEKPAAGKANVQGKAFFNEKPAAGVEVKLCKTFNQYMGGCGADALTTKSDDSGEYLIKDVPPGIYEGLTVKVFDTPYFVFATSGIISAAKYNIEDGKTFFAPDTHLYKNDLKLVSPKAGSKVAAAGIEIKWDAYPDAAYYKYSIHADSASGAETNFDYISKRVDGTSVSLDKPLVPGNYTAKVEAFNANDRKLSQTSQDMKFTVTGAAPK